MKQIYLDNGATSFPKAPGVGQAMKDYIEKVGVNHQSLQLPGHRGGGAFHPDGTGGPVPAVRRRGGPQLCHLYQRRDHEPEYDPEGGAAPR